MTSLVELDLPSRPQGVGTRPWPWVAGPENGLVAPPVTELLGRGATRFNPLVLVGPAGSGKSHLVQGLVRRLRAGSFSTPARIAYSTAADFTRDYLAAVADRRAAAWRSELFAAEVLAIEDLQEFRPESPAQLELRTIVDALLAAGRAALVVTAEREPYALTHLDAGLRDRLAGGLMVRLERPGPDARRQILQLAASARGWELSDAETSALARREVATASQLFGLLLAHVHRREEDAEAASSDVDPTANRRAMKQILAATARYFGVTQADVTGHSRKTAFVRARNVVVCLTRRLTSLSYASIGHALGSRDHTTIMHAEQRAVEQAAADPTLRQAIDELDRILR